MRVALTAWAAVAATIPGMMGAGSAQAVAYAAEQRDAAWGQDVQPARSAKSAQGATSRRALVIDTSDAIPLRDAKHRKNMFTASLTGSAIRGPAPYEVNFDTGSSQLCLPYGCLDKSKLTVLEESVRDCWGTRADKVKGQIGITSRDGRTTYVVDDYVFYAMENEDGSDLPADADAPMNSAIMGAYPCPEAFTYALARKYCKSGFVYGIVCENQTGELAANWDAFRAYLKIGIDSSVAGKLNWHNYTPWFPGQIELQVVNLPGWTVRLSFPKVNGKRIPDIVVPNQIATIDTGAPDLTLRLGNDDPHRKEPYKQYFNDNGPSWYSKDKCRVAGDGVTVEVSFTGSSGQTSSYRWTIRDPKGRYVPNGMIVGDWTAGIPWGEGPETPTNRLNLGNSIYFFIQAHVWDIANRRVGFRFR
jgi:hypothetical protein